jgi:hypothetical protein
MELMVAFPPLIVPCFHQQYVRDNDRGVMLALFDCGGRFRFILNLDGTHGTILPDLGERGCRQQRYGKSGSGKRKDV